MYHLINILPFVRNVSKVPYIQTLNLSKAIICIVCMYDIEIAIDCLDYRCADSLNPKASNFDPKVDQSIAV